jgi:hypothetical protein
MESFRNAKAIIVQKPEEDCRLRKLCMNERIFKNCVVWISLALDHIQGMVILNTFINLIFPQKFGG